MKPIPLVVLTGFLGSGKTTLLRRWRREESLRDAAMIIQDLSEFGLDVELLSPEEATTTAGCLNGRIAALHGSHARELLHASVGQTLENITALDPAPPMVLVESTGAAHPWPLISALTQNNRFSLRHFIVTVDALNLHRDFADGRILTGEASPPEDPALHNAALVLAEQLAFATVIILTKIDTIPKPVIDRQVSLLQKIQPRAAVGLSAQAGLLLSQLDGISPPDAQSMKRRARDLGLADSTTSRPTAGDVEALIFREKRPFHPQRLHEACQNHIGTGLYRTKGFLWIASRPGHVLLWQQSGSQVSLELTGLWRAQIAAEPDGSILAEELSVLKDRLQGEDPVFGDRHIELTLIGLRRDREAFAEALRDALCTDEEVAAWERGESFPDPWPKTLKRVG